MDIQSNKFPLKFLVQLFVTFVISSVAAQPSIADEILENKIQKLQLQQKDLLDQSNRIRKELDGLKASSSNKSGFEYKINGYVKLDAIYDIGPLIGDRLNYSAISASEENGGHFRMHARESRISLTASKNANGQNVKLFLEGDFYGGGTTSSAPIEKISNSNGFRLRHAYLRVGDYTLGQTWSNYVDVKSFPENLDFSNETGQAFLRQAQIRYTHKAGDWEKSISIENPESDTSDFTNCSNGNNCSFSSKDSLPDFVGRIKIGKKWGHVSFQSVLKKISTRFSDGDSIVNNSTLAYGMGVSGKITYSKNQFRFHVSGGEGIGRYIQEAADTSAAHYNVGDRYLLETQKAYGGYFGFQHKWSHQYRTNINTGFIEVDWDVDSPTDQKMRKLHSIHINLIKSFQSGLDAGIEYSKATRYAGASEAEVSRLQFSMKYKF